MSEIPNLSESLVKRDGFAEVYPFPSRFLNARGPRQHYIDEGHGSPLLFVHGNPTWSFIWRRFIRDFSDTHRTIAVDHVGCGLSDKPQNYTYDLATHVNNLCELIEHLDLTEITLVAHDWGGAIAMGAAIRQQPRIVRIALMNTAAFRSRHMPLRIAACRIPLLGAIGVRGFNLFARAALSMAVHDGKSITADVATGLLAPYDNWRNRIAIHRFVQDIPLRASHPSYATLMQIESELARLKHLPIALIWGMRDWCFTPHFLEEFERHFPEAESTRIADAGHYVFEEAYEQTRDALKKLLSRKPS